ncbi:radical SAM protein [Actinoplanes oblitus]|uniref:Radical SAM protein n=1 Tax=Actinoplanes oblitus TaxID=3040509 RepID=A0ABY8WUM0_9ACTN|nr:radical SAM protein [Actinoplanes oblitus]WIN00588.1 radical SAM protein [Actinoplanes oblitus]
MRVLLMSGLGPANLNSGYLSGSLLERDRSPRATQVLQRADRPDLDVSQLAFEKGGRRYALLRPRPDSVPHLTSVTLTSILASSGHDFVRVPLEEVWTSQARPPSGDIDVVLLSSTFIWNDGIVAAALNWIGTHVPDTPVIMGGQYTNLKFMPVMRDHPEVLAVVRGDAEESLPRVLDALQAGASLDGIPNVVWRDGPRIQINPIAYVDMERFPSPTVAGPAPIVPYESMRGCPFDCKFCSFPAASPKWRYKSAEKIVHDWTAYATENHAKMISAMDSTFTVPPTRMRRLLELLPGAGTPPWEGFSRANTINSPELVENLARSRCQQLHIGFESMNDETLKRMSKRVSVRQNRRAGELLSRSDIGYYVFFIVGYPGETPEAFADTSAFLVDEYVGHFALSKFSITDETMPLWQDRDELRIVSDDPTDPTAAWSHIGMDSAEASRLQKETLDRVRHGSETAVLHLWQHAFQHWLMPHRDRLTNIRAEKCVERMAMAPVDYPDVAQAAKVVNDELDKLRDLGIERVEDSRTLCRDAI